MKPIKNKALTAAAVGSTALAITMLGLPSQAANGSPGSHSPGLRGDASQRSTGYYDARQLSGPALVRSDRTMVQSRTSAQSAYYRSLGTQAFVSIDPLTHTPRDFTRLNGYLTGRSSAPARTVALGYVRSHAADLGLKRADLKTLRFRHDYVDTIGVHHLYWAQAANGIPVFGNGLKVNVTRRGQVVSVQGSPVSGLARMAATAPAITRLSAGSARTAAAHNVGGRPQSSRVAASKGGRAPMTVWANHDYAKRVWFLTSSGLRPGWSTYVQTGKAAYQHVIDAQTGRPLFRTPLTHDAAGDAYVYDNYPGAKSGGTAKVVNFFKRGWLTKKAGFLDGSSVIAFSDVNDDNLVENTEKTPVPGTAHGAQFKLQKFGASASSFCVKYVCTWNPNVTNSWKTNRRADATNAFYLGSNFHDYLAKSPIGFTAAAGNFSAAGGDPVLLNTLDGAATGPDGGHIDNANMSTPPDGIPPTMQMYLWHFPGATDAEDPFVPTSGAFDASILYHEYTHGLSNRLVTDANGNGALNTIEAGSMGEAWSDYYALDYLVAKGFLKDTSKAGELLEGKYVAAGQHSIRTMAIDCPVGANTTGCTSGFDPSVHGGYTYGDFATIIGQPEVHASGEIWGQTLWDIRSKLGHTVADTLITRAMSLSPTEPSFLDMRNAILQADMIKYGSSHTPALWKIFAHRGMGYFAAATDGSDAAPAADFHTPPAPQTGRTEITGTVTDPNTGDPVTGAVVHIAGLGDQFSDVTDGGGRYTIAKVFPGTYPKVVASAAGYLPDTESVDTSTPGPADFSVVRDWAASSGGADIREFNGPDLGADCGAGPEGAIDTNLGIGWPSVTGNFGEPTNQFVPKHITVDMHRLVDISKFEVDPSPTCGDAGSASTGDFMIETSPDNQNWTTAATGTFTSANRGHLNDVTPTAGATGVRYVRFTILGNQVPNFSTNCPDGNFSGCQFTDLTEMAVIGSLAP